MKKDQIANEVERIINSVDTIEQVNASPFFKDKVLNKLYEEKEPQVGLFAWFTPSVQLAALVIFIAVNVAVFVKINQQQYSTEVDSFAAAYELTPESDETLFE